MSKSFSLRHQLLRWLFILLIPTLLAGVLVAYKASTYIANKAYDRTLFRAALALADQVEIVNGQLIVELPNEALDFLEYDKDDLIYYRVTDPNGLVVIGEPNLALPGNLPKAGKHLYYDTVFKGENVRVAVFALPLESEKLRGPALIQVAETLNKRDLMTEEIIAAMVIPQLIMVALTIGLLLYGVKRALLPLDRLRDFISHRSQLDLSAVPVSESPQEVQPLLQAMNDLMHRVRESVSLQQRFIADASHQLRTPLAGLQTQAEMALREQDPAVVHGALERMRDSSLRLSHLVNQLLSLARLEPGSGHAIRWKKIDLVALARKTAQDWVPLALVKEIDLGFEGSDTPIYIDGDSLMLSEVLANLINNSIHHTPPQGEITLGVAENENAVVLTITDSGLGIPVEEREKVFERFYSLSESTERGSGLGLAIVREILTAHQASISLDDGPGGKGTRVTITFPKGGTASAHHES